MTEHNQKSAFLKPFFDEVSFGAQLEKLEQTTIDDIITFVSQDFSKRKYTLGLAIDFILLAQNLYKATGRLSDFRQGYSEQDIFAEFEIVKARGNTKANTLTFKTDTGSFGIRKIEENVADFFHGLDRSDYPSAYVYNTGQWTKFIFLLEKAFQLSEQGRYVAVSNLIDFGLSNLTRNIYFDREHYPIRIFDNIIKNYLRTSKDENGGLTFQAIVFGYLFADRPHLHLVADKVRTGSARQKRIGDIDCYDGLTLEYSAEVKDFEIGKSNFERQVGEFIRECERKKTDSAIFCPSYVQDDISNLDIKRTKLIDQENILYIVSTWDWKKQERAYQGMLHYLSHIEQNAKSVQRLLAFVDSLA
ncbi:MULTISPECIES: hypothetical protein [Vibrio harveyi group]|uniref:hypothetical protein n=1 Tax=Vibrio harveyi group TaxID=717610 RepID=UPI00211B4140|nr:hypothetical protein [Vibrio alginolyticus]MCG6280782.1 hypothetical protein [Vibrio diabolicus]MCS0294277.1 hypothetical protein [Vibrio alginolyticus]